MAARPASAPLPVQRHHTFEPILVRSNRPRLVMQRVPSSPIKLTGGSLPVTSLRPSEGAGSTPCNPRVGSGIDPHPQAKSAASTTVAATKEWVCIAYRVAQSACARRSGLDRALTRSPAEWRDASSVRVDTRCVGPCHSACLTPPRSPASPNIGNCLTRLASACLPRGEGCDVDHRAVVHRQILGLEGTHVHFRFRGPCGVLTSIPRR